MPQLMYSPASPYSAKVRMAAAYAAIPLQTMVVDTNADPADLVAANPLGKIPTLVTDEGHAIFDSRVITQYLNRESKRPSGWKPSNSKRLPTAFAIRCWRSSTSAASVRRKKSISPGSTANGRRRCAVWTSSTKIHRSCPRRSMWAISRPAPCWPTQRCALRVNGRRAGAS